MIAHVAGAPSDDLQKCDRCGETLVSWAPGPGTAMFFRTGATVYHEDGAMATFKGDDQVADDCKPWEVEGVDIS